MNRSNLKAYVYLSLTVLFWTINAIVARKFTSEIPPLFLNWVRWTIAGIILLLITRKNLKKNFIAYTSDRKSFFRLSVLGFLSVGLYNSILYYASLTTLAININLLNTLIPITTVSIWHVVQRRMIPLPSVLGLLITFIGTLTVITQASLEFFTHLNFMSGDLWMITAVLCWAIYTVLLKAWDDCHRHLTSLNLLFLLVFSGWIFSTLFTFLNGDFFSYRFARPHLIAFIYVGIFPSIIAYLFWILGVKTVGASKSSFFIYLMPIFGALLGFLFLGEKLQAYHAFGLVMIVVGFLLISQDRNH